MHADFYQASPQDVRRPSSAPIAIHDAGAPVAQPVSSKGRAGCERPFCGPERNSRVSFGVSGRSLTSQWKAQLPSGFRPSFVIASGDRILVDGEDAWVLLDQGGKTLQRENRGEGEICADASTARFYTPNSNGYLAAYDLRDGRRTFILSLYFGNDFRRTFILPKGHRLLVASVERPNDPHGSRKPNMSVVELHEITTPLTLSDVGRVTSERRVNDLKRRTATLLVAAHSDTLALATVNSVYLADYELKLHGELTEDFEPLQMSLDEQPRIYMVVRSQGALELWVVTTTGQRVTRVRLPAGFTPMAPPIVGFDHSVYLVSPNGIVAVSSSGKLLWTRAPEAVAGAVVDSDNSLLVSAGSTLTSWSPQGDPRILFRAEGERLTTPPAVTPSGDLIVAGEKSVYLLR